MAEAEKLAQFGRVTATARAGRREPSEPRWPRGGAPRERGAPSAPVLVMVMAGFSLASAHPPITSAPGAQGGGVDAGGFPRRRGTFAHLGRASPFASPDRPPPALLLLPSESGSVGIRRRGKNDPCSCIAEKSRRLPRRGKPGYYWGVLAGEPRKIAEGRTDEKRASARATWESPGAPRLIPALRSRAAGKRSPRCAQIWGSREGRRRLRAVIPVLFSPSAYSFLGPPPRRSRTAP